SATSTTPAARPARKIVRRWLDPEPAWPSTPPLLPLAMIEPTLRFDMTDATLRLLAMLSADSEEPSEQNDAAEPTEPIESTDPLLPMLSSESSDHSDHRELMRPGCTLDLT